MKLFLIVISIAFTNTFCHAPIDTILYSINWKETDNIDSVKYYRVTEFNNKTQLYKIKDYYLSGKIQMEALSKDKHKNLFIDKVIWYAENGDIEKYINYNSASQKHGESKIYISKDVVYGEGFYFEDSLDGSWNWYYSNGNKSAIETYDKGKLIDIKGWDENGKEEKLSVDKYSPKLWPQFPGGESKMMQFIFINLRYPKKARRNGIEGKVYVTFSIEKNGEMTNIKIARGVDPILDEEALRVVKLMPYWIPGKLHNIKSRVKTMTIPFNFKLQ